MIVVSDTTPLITLMKAHKLTILQNLFGQVFIPEAVFSELTTNQTHQDEATLIMNSDFITVVQVADSERVSFLRRATGLDLGESEAIIYADEVKADVLLMDEMAGRRVAQNMELPMTGSIGVLIQAFRSDLLTEAELEDAFDLIRTSNQHVSERLLTDALNAIRNVEGHPELR